MNTGKNRRCLCSSVGMVHIPHIHPNLEGKATLYQSRKLLFTDIYSCSGDIFILPMHLLRSKSNLKPSRHSQRKLPNVFLQIWSQPPLLFKHSLVSEAPIPGEPGIPGKPICPV